MDESLAIEARIQKPFGRKAAEKQRGKETKELFLLGFFAALRPKDFVFYPFLFAPWRENPLFATNG